MQCLIKSGSSSLLKLRTQQEDIAVVHCSGVEQEGIRSNSHIWKHLPEGSLLYTSHALPTAGDRSDCR